MNNPSDYTLQIKDCLKYLVIEHSKRPLPLKILYCELFFEILVSPEAYSRKYSNTKLILVYMRYN